MIADQEGEQAVLCALLIHAGQPAVLATIRRILPDPDMLADVQHRAIYRAVLELAEDGAQVDPQALLRRLATHHAAVRVDPGYVAEIADLLAPLANLEYHAKVVRDRWQRRQVVEQARAAITLAEDLRAPVATTIAGVVDRLTQTHQGGHRPAVSARQGASDVLFDLDQAAQLGTHVTGIGTTLPELDRITAGWQPGQLWIVGARPSTGKTSFAVEAALAATDVGPVLFCSAEMPQRQIYRRMIGRLSGVNLREVGNRDSWALGFPKVKRAADQLAALPIRVEDARLSAADIRQAVSEWAAELGEPPRLVVVDYLGKLSAGRRSENRNVEVGYISAALARVAVDLNVPVLCAHQLSRASVKDGKPRRPNQSDLRDSGSIEQDADGIVLLYTPLTQPDNRPSYHAFHTEVIVEKNRNGETGLLHTWHDRATGTWSEMGFHERRGLEAA